MVKQNIKITPVELGLSPQSVRLARFWNGRISQEAQQKRRHEWQHEKAQRRNKKPATRYIVGKSLKSLMLQTYLTQGHYQKHKAANPILD